MVCLEWAWPLGPDFKAGPSGSGIMYFFGNLRPGHNSGPAATQIASPAPVFEAGTPAYEFLRPRYQKVEAGCNAWIPVSRSPVVRFRQSFGVRAEPTDGETSDLEELENARMSMLRQWGLEAKYEEKPGRTEGVQALIKLAIEGPSAYLEAGDGSDDEDASEEEDSGDNSELALEGFPISKDVADSEGTDRFAAPELESNVQFEEEDGGEGGGEGGEESGTGLGQVEGDLGRLLSKRERKKEASRRRREGSEVVVVEDPNAFAVRRANPVLRHLDLTKAPSSPVGEDEFELFRGDSAAAAGAAAAGVDGVVLAKKSPPAPLRESLEERWARGMAEYEASLRKQLKAVVSQAQPRTQGADGSLPHSSDLEAVSAFFAETRSEVEAEGGQACDPAAAAAAAGGVDGVGEAEEAAFPAPEQRIAISLALEAEWELKACVGWDKKRAEAERAVSGDGDYDGDESGAELQAALLASTGRTASRARAAQKKALAKATEDRNEARAEAEACAKRAMAKLSELEKVVEGALNDSSSGAPAKAVGSDTNSGGGGAVVHTSMCNQLLRWGGKAQLLPAVLTVLDLMATTTTTTSTKNPLRPSSSASGIRRKKQPGGPGGGVAAAGRASASSSSSSDSKVVWRPIPDSETFEHVGTAFVKEVKAEARATSMATLPSPFEFQTKHKAVQLSSSSSSSSSMATSDANTGSGDKGAILGMAAAGELAGGGESSTSPSPSSSSRKAIKEVVFVGRSNVGKSSLVNMLCGRKALASTSADPGHTRKFFFYHVNPGRNRHRNRNPGDETAAALSKLESESGQEEHDDGGDGGSAASLSPSLLGVPEFRLVDVPGLGFAKADEGDKASWRALLERYLSVRDGLSVVFHLVDAKTGLQKADEELMRMSASALQERRQRQQGNSNDKDGYGGADSSVLGEVGGENIKEGESSNQEVRYMVVLTKADRLAPSEATKQLKLVKVKVAAAFEAAAGEARARLLSETTNSEEEEGEGVVEETPAPVLVTPEVIVTSSKARPPVGRERLWKCLWETLVD